MRFLRLRSTDVRFREVNFKDNGLTIITGVSRQDGEIEGDNDTYNGVGKSLIIEIMHFCLASNRIRAFEESLEECDFVLEFMIGGSINYCQRNTKRQGDVIINGETHNVKAARDILSSLVLKEERPKELSFRNCLQAFLRRRKSDYNYPDRFEDDTDYLHLLRNFFLLGLDYSLIIEKQQLRQSESDIKSKLNQFKTDDMIKEFYTNSKDPDIRITYLRDKIRDLQKDLTNFHVAENYHDLQREANSISRAISSIKNRIQIAEYNLDNISKSLERRVDITTAEIQDVYEDAKIYFSEILVKRLDDVESFHNLLLANRQDRLSRQQITLRAEVQKLYTELEDKSQNLNERLSALNGLHALDQLVAVTNSLASLRAEYDNLLKYRGMVKKLKDELAKTKQKMLSSTMKGAAYLEEEGESILSISDIFRDLGKKFYPDNVTALSITNNEGDNQKRFNFDPIIDNDSSDGINEIRIFCYDMNVLLSSANHKFNFIFHDSRIFGDIDFRKLPIIFREAARLTENMEYQYICTINQGHLEQINKLMTDEEYRRIIEPNIVLQLSDDSPANKLLGYQVNMRY